jgi:hypothetical protein
MPTREQLDAMRENIHTLLATCPAPEPDGSEDDPNMAVYSYAWQQSWLDLETQLRWTPCNEAMPTEAREYECVLPPALPSLAQGALIICRWAMEYGFYRLWCGTVRQEPSVTHWRPWSGWPGEEK